jgi:hypothetical protein
MSDYYTKDILDQHFQSVSHKYADIKDSLTRIESQTTLTNGKVAALQRWKEQWVGAVKAIGIFGTIIIVPLVSWAFYTIAHLDDRVDSGIKEALSDYEVTIQK